jgi:hypothetical protein
MSISPRTLAGVLVAPIAMAIAIGATPNALFRALPWKPSTELPQDVAALTVANVGFLAFAAFRVGRHHQGLSDWTPAEPRGDTMLPVLATFRLVVP